ncbi:MAG: tRNA lysidine(34) synthetase TilS [Candidatus Izemoplasmataceae bacterium]
MQSIESVKLFLSQNFKKDEPIVLALSGGLDSMVLFDILNKNDYHIIIAHINHKKRKESDFEYEAIKNLALNHKIPFEGYILNDTLTDNFHDEARQIRLDFFKDVALKYNTNKILLAHHLDDQIETFFMKFFKGSPLTNLAPIEPITIINNINIYRPLLKLKKSTLLAYAKDHNITYYHDVSNDSTLYTRNRYRNKVIPILQEEVNHLDDVILTRLSQFKALNDLINDEAIKFIRKRPYQIETFNALNPLIKEAILKHLINNYTHGDYDISKALINHLIMLLSTYESNLTYPITEQLLLNIEYDEFFIASKPNKELKSIVIDKEGTYDFDTCKSIVVTHEKSSHISSNYVVLWYNSKVFPLVLRTRQPKDKIHLSFGHKKIKDLMIDKKIPPSQRNEIMLLTNDEEVLWIPFLKLRSESFKHGSKKLYVYEVFKC